jgi:hypothetical protein
LFVVCSKCGRYIREKEPLWDTSISHGICEECCKGFKNEIRRIN